MNSTTEIFQGQACWRWQLPQGDSVLVSAQGAQVLSWQSAGRERLYLSPQSVFDGHTPIRGGVPICFPQFNQRGALPKHGFARNMAWQLAAPPEQSTVGQATFEFLSKAQTMAMWPFDFCAQLQVNLTPGSLQLSLTVHNTGVQALQFTGAMHTYLAVQDIAQTRLLGLQGQDEWDSLTDQHQKSNGVLQFDGEFDRVYQTPPVQDGPTWLLQDQDQNLEITQSASWGQSVVWNPGANKCAALSDMPPAGYQHMLCVEAAQVEPPITIAPASQWQGWQKISVLP